MAGVGGFRGVSAAQDSRFSNKSKLALKKMKFPAELDLPVDYDKVNWTVMKEWVAKRVTELLGLEEEVLISMIHNHLIDTRTPPKEMSVELTPFLEKNTSLFMKELWAMLHSASRNESGVPQQLLEAKQKELAERREREAAIQQQVALKLKQAEMERVALQAQMAATAVATAPPAGGKRPSRFDQPAPVATTPAAAAAAATAAAVAAAAAAAAAAAGIGALPPPPAAFPGPPADAAAVGNGRAGARWDRAGDAAAARQEAPGAAADAPAAAATSSPQADKQPKLRRADRRSRSRSRSRDRERDRHRGSRGSRRSRSRSRSRERYSRSRYERRQRSRSRSRSRDRRRDRDSDRRQSKKSSDSRRERDRDGDRDARRERDEPSGSQQREPEAVERSPARSPAREAAADE